MNKFKELNYLLKDIYIRNKKKIIKITSIVIIINALLVGIYVSYSYYEASGSVDIINNQVTNVLFPGKDLVIRVFVGKDNKYQVTDYIPTNNYSYKSHRCLNNSILIYDNVNKVTTVTATTGDICEIYFEEN